MRNFYLFALIFYFTPGLWAQQSESASPAAGPPGPMTSAPPRREAHLLLERTLGGELIDLFSRKGYFIRYGNKKPELLHVQWPPLRALIQRRRDLTGLLALYDKIRDDQVAGNDKTDFGALLKLPIAGFWTPALKSAAEILASHLENISLLGDQAHNSTPLLFAAPWGRAYLERMHADLITDFRPLSGNYFSEILSTPGRPNEAPGHLSDYIKAAYDKNIGKLLGRDLSSAQLSDELSGWIAKYLSDQRRLWLISLTQTRLKDLERSTTLSNDLRDLSLASGGLEPLGALLAPLSAALEREIISPEAHLSADKLHVHSRQGAPFDQGDTVEVSAAYWVELADPRGSAPVLEAGFIDGGTSGISQARFVSAKRTAGGPHVFTANLRLNAPGKIKYRLFLGAPGAQPLSLEADIEVSARLPDLLKLASRAESAAADCRLDDASQGYDELNAFLTPLSDKSQFKELRTSLAQHRKTALDQALVRKNLLAQLPAVALHASRDRCDFNGEISQRALSSLNQLPPGCDRVPAPNSTAGSAPLAAELMALGLSTDRRRNNQSAFLAAAAKGRKAEKACLAVEAADSYESALAFLDSEPEARCGALEKEYASVESIYLPRARTQIAVASSLAQSQSQASRLFSTGNYGESLAEINALIARIDTLPNRNCFAAQRRKAEDLAAAAAVSLAPPDPDAVKASLPQDAASQEAREATAERKRRTQQEDAEQEKEALTQAPAGQRPVPAAVKPDPTATKLPSWTVYESTSPVIPKQTRKKIDRHKSQRTDDGENQ